MGELPEKVFPPFFYSDFFIQVIHQYPHKVRYRFDEKELLSIVSVGFGFGYNFIH
jgi:hypothetical protein